MGSSSGEGKRRGSWLREHDTIVLHEVPVPEHIPAPYAIAAESVFASVPLEFAPHTHTVHELVWVRGGTMTVRVGDLLVTVPDGHGLWIPAGAVHSGRMTARTTLSDALFDSERSPLIFTRATVIEVTPLLGSLLTHLERDDLDQEARLRAEAVVFDVLAPAPQHFALQVPRVDRLRPIVSALLENPSDDRMLPEWAALLGTSERTVARLFRTHTGLSFLQWRQVLRVHHALTLMSEGLAVQDVAEMLGYAQSSTFIASFKRVMGMTPGAFQAEQARVPIPSYP